MMTVEHLSKSFGDVKAVDDLSFEIASGHVVGFLGPNGAGKTTTMRLLAGFLVPDAGRILIDGISVVEAPAQAQARVGYLPENNPLYKDMLVSDLLTLSLALKHVPTTEQKAALDFAVPAVGIEGVFYRPISELSKGYKQRVGIAMALLAKPKVIILDEPTEGLDPNQRGDIRTLIKSLAKNHTVLLSTHVMQEASALCDRILIINKGKLVADGTPSELQAQASKESRLLLDLEGTDIEAALASLAGVVRTELTRDGNRTKGLLVLDQPETAVPALSKLIRERGWTVWDLHPEAHSLEEVFHQLTLAR
jgi:ABC-2 type transport system ATP-binding protein